MFHRKSIAFSKQADRDVRKAIHHVFKILFAQTNLKTCLNIALLSLDKNFMMTLALQRNIH